MLGSDYPLSLLYSTRNLLKKLVDAQTLQPTVNIVGQTAIIHDTAVRLDEIGGMFRSLSDEIAELEREITLGLCDTHPSFQLDLSVMLSDEPNNTLIDFFFGDIPRNGFVGCGDRVIDVFLTHERFRGRYLIDTGDGRFSYNPAACTDLMLRFAQLDALLFASGHISCGPPPRGPEVAALHLRNSPGGDIRNVKIIQGMVCLVGGYNKTTHQVRNTPSYTTITELTDPQTEELKVMFRFPPNALVPYLLREWLLYRPLRVLIARVLGMDELAHRLRYLVFPGFYKPLESQDFSDMLRASTMNHLGYEIGLHDWRQIESNFVQTFCEGAVQESAEPAHFAQRGQTAKTGLRHYNRTRNYPNGVAIQVIQAHLQSSQFWQDLTGKSPRPVPSTTPRSP